MKGINIITAIALIADISELKRFKNSKKLASYLRSAPGADSSNENKLIKVKTVLKYAWQFADVYLPKAIRCLRKRNIIITGMKGIIQIRCNHM